MLTKLNPSDKSAIVDFRVSVKNKFIEVEIEEGTVVDSSFIPDGRPAKKYRIANIPDRHRQEIDIDLVVNASKQVTLSRNPIDNNPVTLEGIDQDHDSGSLVTCTDNAENDLVTVSYYYLEAGRDWFNEVAAFVRDASFDGLNDYDYLSKRLWTILLDMKQVQGSLI